MPIANFVQNGNLPEMGSQKTVAIEQLLATDIAEIELPGHICNALANSGITTVADLVNTPESKLKKVLGLRRLAQLEQRLSSLGLKAAQ